MLGFIKEFDNKGVYHSFPKHNKRKEITLFQNLRGELLTTPNIKEGKGFPPLYIYIEREREVKILFCFVPKMKKLSLFYNNKKANIILCISLLI